MYCLCSYIFVVLIISVTATRNNSEERAIRHEKSAYALIDNGQLEKPYMNFTKQAKTSRKVKNFFNRVRPKLKGLTQKTSLIDAEQKLVNKTKFIKGMENTSNKDFMYIIKKTIKCNDEHNVKTGLETSHFMSTEDPKSEYGDNVKINNKIGATSTNIEVDAPGNKTSKKQTEELTHNKYRNLLRLDLTRGLSSRINDNSVENNEPEKVPYVNETETDKMNIKFKMGDTSTTVALDAPRFKLPKEEMYRNLLRLDITRGLSPRINYDSVKNSDPEKEPCVNETETDKINIKFKMGDTSTTVALDAPRFKLPKEEMYRNLLRLDVTRGLSPRINYDSVMNNEPEKLPYVNETETDKMNIKFKMSDTSTTVPQDAPRFKLPKEEIYRNLLRLDLTRGSSPRINYNSVKNNEPKKVPCVNETETDKTNVKFKMGDTSTTVALDAPRYKSPNKEMYRNLLRLELTPGLNPRINSDFVKKYEPETIYFMGNATHKEINKISASQYADIAIDKSSHFNKDFSVIDQPEKKVRVLCWIMTEARRHVTNAAHVKATWGKRCDQLVFMSSAKDFNLPALNLHVADGRDHLWEKTMKAFSYVHEYFRDKADWFLKADDDTYVIMENLRLMLAEFDSTKPLYFGCRFKPFTRQGYMSGGAGYVLSRAALDRLSRAIQIPDMCNVFSTSAEDVELGKCMERIGVRAMDTRDHLGRGRFFPFPPREHFFPDKKKMGWYYEYIYYPTGEGQECCSNTAISFHGLEGRDMYILQYLIYHLKPHGQPLLGTRALPTAPPRQDIKYKIVPAEVAEVQYNVLD